LPGLVIEERAVRLTVKGQSHDVDIDPGTPLLWVLQDSLGMTGAGHE